MNDCHTRKGSTELVLICGVLLLGICAGGIYYVFLQSEPEEIEPKTVETTSEKTEVKKTADVENVRSQKSVKKAQKNSEIDPFLKKRDELNKTVYKNEVLAQEHEKILCRTLERTSRLGR